MVVAKLMIYFVTQKNIVTFVKQNEADDEA